MFRPETPLLPNYKYVPIGYHGRASSIVISGAEVTRPSGQTLAAGAKVPTFGPTQMLDYEEEVGFFVGRGNERGGPIPIGEGGDHTCEVCLAKDCTAVYTQR